MLTLYLDPILCTPLSHFKDQLRFGTIEPIDIIESQQSIFDNKHENIILFLPCEKTIENELWNKLITYYPNETNTLQPSLNDTFILNNKFEDNRTFFLCFNRNSNQDIEDIFFFILHRRYFLFINDFHRLCKWIDYTYTKKSWNIHEPNRRVI